MTPSKDAGGEPSQRRVKMTTDDLDQLRAQLIRRGLRPTVLDLVRSSDAAKVLGLAPKTLRNWRASDRGPHYTTIGGSVYYPLADLATFIEAGRGRPARPDTSRDRLARDKRTRDHDAMNLTRLETRIPAPVASAIRELAKREGTTTARLLEDALRHYSPVVEAMAPSDITRKHDG